MYEVHIWSEMVISLLWLFLQLEFWKYFFLLELTIQMPENQISRGTVLILDTRGSLWIPTVSKIRIIPFQDTHKIFTSNILKDGIISLYQENIQIFKIYFKRLSKWKKKHPKMIFLVPSYKFWYLISIFCFQWSFPKHSFKFVSLGTENCPKCLHEKFHKAKALMRLPCFLEVLFSSSDWLTHFF